jgi:UDP-N-acetyl-D-glucosamine dehydrogenase
VLVLGIAYKRDVEDLRESPALEILRLLQEKGSQVFFHDPHCPVIADDGHTLLRGLPMRSSALSESLLAAVDVVVVVTDHAAVDYQQVADCARLVVDSRGVMRRFPGRARVVGLSGQEQSAVEPPVVPQP